MTEIRKSAVKEQFDKTAGKYLSRYLTPEKIREKERIIGLVKSREKLTRILDLGCGPAIITGDLLEVSDEAYGVDFSEDMIRVAKSKYCGSCQESQVFFSVGDAEKLDFPDHFFDAVVCLGVLRYLDSLENGLQEINRVLKPGGITICTFYHRYSIYWLSMILLYRPLLPFISLAKKETLSDLKIRLRAEPSPFSYKRFRRVFSETGFVHTDTLHSGICIFPLNRIFPGISRAVNLKTETLLLKSEVAGWMGSICTVKGIKK